MPKKKKATPQPKPSTLLKRSLELLSEGRRWIKGSLRITAKQAMRDNWDDKPYVDVNLGGRMVSRFIKDEAYCMIGACDKINTKRETEALKFLAQAINGSTPSQTTKAEAQDTIMNFNDSGMTLFRHVSAKFRKAIRLAKAAGA